MGIKLFKSEGIGKVPSFSFMCGVTEIATVKGFTHQFLKQGSSSILIDIPDILKTLRQQTRMLRKKPNNIFIENKKKLKNYLEWSYCSFLGNMHILNFGKFNIKYRNYKGN